MIPVLTYSNYGYILLQLEYTQGEKISRYIMLQSIRRVIMGWEVFYRVFSIGMSVIVFFAALNLIFSDAAKRRHSENARYKRMERKAKNLHAKPIGSYNEALDIVAGAIINYKIENRLTTEDIANVLDLEPKTVLMIENQQTDLTLRELTTIVNKLNGKLEINIML